MIYLNQHFGIKNTNSTHVNILLNKDIELFIDPLILKSKGDFNSKIHLRCVNFLTKLNDEYVKKRKENDALIFLSKLHEPKEYRIGYSNNSFSGKAIGTSKSKTIYNSLLANPLNQPGVSILNDPFNLLLLVEGIGQDNISDLIANICRDLFCEFTYYQCLKYNIPVFETKIEYFCEISGNWITKTVLLPNYLNKEIILIPEWMVNKQIDFSAKFNRHVSIKYIWKEYTSNGNFLKNPHLSDCYTVKKDGTYKLRKKSIYNKFRKNKKDFYKFILKYNDSINTFIDNFNSSYPKLSLLDLEYIYIKSN